MERNNRLEKIHQAPIILSSNLPAVVVVSIFAAAIASTHGNEDSLDSDFVVGVFGLLSFVLGVWLGYRAQREIVTHLFRTGLAMAWRVGACWILLFCGVQFMEDTDESAMKIVRLTPMLLWAVLLGLPSGFLVLRWTVILSYKLYESLALSTAQKISIALQFAVLAVAIATFIKML